MTEYLPLAQRIARTREPGSHQLCPQEGTHKVAMAAVVRLKQGKSNPVGRAGEIAQGSKYGLASARIQVQSPEVHAVLATETWHGGASL